MIIAQIGLNTWCILQKQLDDFLLMDFCLYFQSGLGDFSFLPFTVLLGAFFLFTVKFVPETKNKTIEEILQNLNKQSGTSNVYEQEIHTTDDNTMMKF